MFALGLAALWQTGVFSFLSDGPGSLCSSCKIVLLNHCKGSGKLGGKGLGVGTSW